MIEDNNVAVMGVAISDNAYLIVFRYQRLSLNLYMYDIFTVVVKKIGIMLIISLSKTQS